MRAEEERQAKAANDGKRNKQKSKRRGRISTVENLAKATLEEDAFPLRTIRKHPKTRHPPPLNSSQKYNTLNVC